MADTNKLRQLILNSLMDLKSRYNSLSNDDIAVDLINVICNYIITYKNLDFKSGAQPMLFFQYNWNNCSSFVAEVILSLENELSGVISKQTCQALSQNICLNLGWDGMPVFLDNYFSEKHGQALLNDREFFDFMSIKHERYVSNCMEAISQVDRNIKISCWNDRNDMTIEITPTLSLKKAHLINKSKHLYIYEGDDPDYIFEIRFDEADEVVCVSVLLLSRNLKLLFY